MAGGEVALLQSHNKHTQLGAAFAAPGVTGNGGETTASSKPAARAQSKRPAVRSTRSRVSGVTEST